jgi:hypothetical protein
VLERYLEKGETALVKKNKSNDPTFIGLICIS